MNEETSNGTAYEIDLDNLPKAELTGHAWRQQGTMLQCTSCTFSHGTFLDPEYQLYGIDGNGMPLIRKIAVKD
jgi:hypothetical protein